MTSRPGLYALIIASFLISNCDNCINHGNNNKKLRENTVILEQLQRDSSALKEARKVKSEFVGGQEVLFYDIDECKSYISIGGINIGSYLSNSLTLSPTELRKNINRKGNPF